jgi:hypothetical protein
MQYTYHGMSTEAIESDKLINYWRAYPIIEKY